MGAVGRNGGYGGRASTYWKHTASGLGVYKAQARGPAACMTCGLGRDKHEHR